MTPSRPHRLAGAIAVGLLLIGVAGSACGGSSDGGPATTATTVPAIDRDAYARAANQECTEGAAKAAAVQPTSAMTPEQTVEAFRALVTVTRETLGRLRALTPPTPAKPYTDWLDAVDRTATLVEQAASAKAAGDEALAQDRFNEAGKLSATAASAAKLLGLGACTFDGGSASTTTAGPPAPSTAAGPPAPTDPSTTSAPPPSAAPGSG